MERTTLQRRHSHRNRVHTRPERPSESNATNFGPLPVMRSSILTTILLVLGTHAMTAESLIREKLDLARARRQVLDAEIGLLESLQAELDSRQSEKAPAPKPAAKTITANAPSEDLAPRDSSKRESRILALGKLLIDGPKSTMALCSLMDCADPTTIGLLKLSPYFEKDGTSRFAPWKLSNAGRLWIGKELNANPS